MGFVLVQHLDPTHKSALADILGRATRMPVQVVTPGLRVKPNHLYVIPPDKNLSIQDGQLKLPPRSKTGHRPRSIDFFFEALAQDQEECAIGIILSGTASDGTLGLEAIKAKDGITFAQDASAAYDSMPRNAVAAGCVDFIQPPEAMARELARIAQHPSVARKIRQTASHSGTAGLRGSQSPLDHGQENGWKKILLLLRNHSGVDFSLYKSNTIDRRITRRMILNKKNTFADYATFLRGNEKELGALYSDVLINVTSFFRDPEAFETLKHQVFSKLLLNASNETKRAWVVGCSTGQEAYSIAMAFMESAGQSNSGAKLQIFASDLNEANLAKARAGLYPKNVVQDIPPARLRRFFAEEKGGYRIAKSLREMCVFARQNIVNDPPFSRIDLISCRNVMIYLESDVQKRILPLFHYALKPDGFLLLGASESIGSFTQLFEPVDKKHKIFCKRPVKTPAFRLVSERYHPEAAKDAPASQPDPSQLPPELNVQREADRITLNRYAPPAVLVDADMEILQFRGETSPYLKPPVGAATLSVVKMARDGLLPPLRVALNQAKKDNKITRKENIRVNRNDRSVRVNLEVIPLKNLKERFYLILFEDASKQGQPPVEEDRSSASKREASARLAESERELVETRDFAQAQQEQHEATSQELQAQSEELQSANEELQSINEELETSKEELESTNEELITVNDEMANRNSELNRLLSDLKNLHDSLNTGIVLLGRDLTIRSFTPLADQTFKFTAVDLGRPLGDIRHNLDFPDLEEFISGAIDAVSVREREVRDREGRWYSLRVRPYLSLDNKIEGAVLVLIDIDKLKRSEQELRDTISELEVFSYTIAHDLRAPLRSMESFAELLAEDCGKHIGREGKDYIHRITAAAERMDKLIQDVLDYSRIARTSLTMVPVDPQALLAGIRESYGNLQPPRAEIVIDGAFPKVMANEAMLTQCMSNLLGNAVKFVAPGVMPRIRVWARNRGARVRLSFQDNGIGIEKDMQEKVFEIFQQLNKRYEGTGIGLAIVKKTVERMGGDVGVESNPGKGSTFWIELAAARNAA